MKKALRVVAFRKVVDLDNDGNNGTDEDLVRMMEEKGWTMTHDRHYFTLALTGIGLLRRMFLDEMRLNEEERAKPTLYYLKKAAEIETK